MQLTLYTALFYLQIANINSQYEEGSRARFTSK